MKTAHFTRYLLAILLILPATLLSAEDAPTVKDLVETKDAVKVVKEIDATPAKGPHDEYGRSTPRSSVLHLAKALIDKDFEAAVNYMDLRNLPFTVNEEVGAELARKLYIVASRTMIVDYEAISDDPNGDLEDGLPSYRDRVTTIKTSEGPVDILMQRVPRGDGVFIWKLSNATARESAIAERAPTPTER